MLHSKHSVLFGAVTLMLLISPLQAVEIYTNRTGGGDWDDPVTWMGNRVPTADDVAVISREDHVVFARNDADTITCKDLHIDGHGSLTFKQHAGDITLTIGGMFQSNGALLLDGTRNSNDVMTIRFVGGDPETRGGRFMQDGSLVLRGAVRAADGIANVRLISCPPDTAEAAIAAKISLEDGCGIDVRHVRFDHVSVYVADIDNTGAEQNERVNITDCHFVGQSDLTLMRCDSPVVTDCRFERTVYTGANAGMLVHFCPLAELRNISIKGPYYYGINSHGNTDAFVENMTIDGSQLLMYWYGSGAMIRNLTLRNASSTGVLLNYMSGMIDGLITENCPLPVSNNVATSQISNWRAIGINETNPVAAEFNEGRLSLLNCDIKPQWVKLHADAKPHANDDSTEPLVQAMQFMVVAVDGEPPLRSVVEVKTANRNPPLNPNQMDLNIRNNPAPISSIGLTPPPVSQRSLTVASWSYGLDRALSPAPTYTVTVLGPPDDNGTRKSLKSATATPDETWFCNKLSAPEPNVTIKLP